MSESNKNSEDPARQLVRQLIDDSHYTMKSLSIACGRNHAYFQQYLNKGKPVELHEVVRNRLSKIFNIRADHFRSGNTLLNCGPQAEIPANGAEKGDEPAMTEQVGQLWRELGRIEERFNHRVSQLERQLAEAIGEADASPSPRASKEQ